MFRNITIGQFYPADSLIHRLDPRVKLLGVVIYVAALFIINNILGFIYLAAALVALIAISKVPLPYILRGMKFIWFIAAIAVFFNLFFSKGDTVVWKWWIFTLTEKGMLNAAFFTLRLLLVIIGAAMLTYTTSPTSLTAGLEKVMNPLRAIKFPAHEIAMMMSIALRFIPILAEEVTKIVKAQSSRGAEFDTGGLLARAKGMIPVFVPLFVSAFRRATDLATAMEARCYSGGNRTKMYPLKYEKRDKAGYFILLGYLLISVAARVTMDAFVTWGRI